MAKNKISLRIEESTDLLLDEIARLTNTDKSQVIRILLDLKLDELTDADGNFKEKIYEEIQIQVDKQLARFSTDLPEPGTIEA